MVVFSTRKVVNSGRYGLIIVDIIPSTTIEQTTDSHYIISKMVDIVDNKKKYPLNSIFLI